jgi:hypothetical protein
MHTGIFDKSVPLHFSHAFSPLMESTIQAPYKARLLLLSPLLYVSYDRALSTSHRPPRNVQKWRLGSALYSGPHRSMLPFDRDHRDVASAAMHWMTFRIPVFRTRFRYLIPPMRCYNLTEKLKSVQNLSLGAIPGRGGNGFAPTPASIGISISRRDTQRPYGLIRPHHICSEPRHLCRPIGV